MTIVMEEDAFSSSLSSLSTLSPQSNYQALIGRDSLNSSYLSTNSAIASTTSLNQTPLQQQQQQQQNSLSPNGNNSSNQENCPYVVFIFRSNNNNTSELFEERRISLDKPCKIGRSVAKIRPEPNNAIFDCKVLSRNHALLWEEKGKFYLQDTKSSNGTFLNGNRLGKSNEDSAPYELTSGDIIQFGVDVTENTKKVTHGCITVEVRLFHRPGVEAINKPNQQNNKVDVQTQELYQLALFLQEAMMREEILNQKLRSLQTFIDQAKETSENGWLTLIQEDRLLSRIDCLEKQTNLNNKNVNEEQFKKTINNLRDEKLRIENSAKETIQKMIEEKNELSQRLDELKTMYQTQDEECNQFQKLNEELRSKILDLAGKNQDLLTQIDKVQVDMNDAKTKYTDKINNLDADKFKYEAQLADFAENEKKLNAQIELLTAEKEIQSKQLENLLIKLEQSKQLNEFKKVENIPIENHNNHNENDHDDHDHNDVGDDDFKENLNLSLEKLKENHHASSTEHLETDNKFLINNNINKNEVLNDVSNNIINETESTNNSNCSNSKEFVNNSLHISKNLIDENEKENLNISAEHDINVNSVNKESLLENLTNNSVNSVQLNIELNKLNQEIENLKSKLENEMNTSNRLNNELSQFKAQAINETSSLLLNKSSSNNINNHFETTTELNEKINELEKQLEEKNSLINQLLISKNELVNLNFKNLITSDMVNNSNLNDDKSNDSFDNNNLIKTTNEESIDLNTSKSNLSFLRDESNINKRSTTNYLSNEYYNLKDDYIQLKSQIQIIEISINKILEDRPLISNQNENDHFKSLEESCQKLKELKDNLENKESNLTNAQKEQDSNINKIVNLESKLKELQDKCGDYESKLNTTGTVLEDLNEGYDNLSLRAKIVSYFSMIPLCFLVFAILIAFYPTLATITATGL